jgi:hypothetical protein
VLVHEPRLHDGWLAAFDAAAPAFAALPKAVLYGFAADATCEALANADTALLREPQPDAVLAQWLRGLADAAGPHRPAAGERQLRADPCRRAAGTMPRWPTSRACRRPSPANARVTSPSCCCSCRTSRPTAPIASTASVRRRTARLPAAGRGRGARTLRGRRSNRWRCTKGCCCPRRPRARADVPVPAVLTAVKRSARRRPIAWRPTLERADLGP